MESRHAPDEARRNFVLAILSVQASPTGRGTKRDWLEYYKLRREGETYVFLDLEGETPAVDDVLWFQVDDHIIARVRIARVFLDPARDLYELWYNGSEIIRVDGVRTEERGTRKASPKALWLSSVPTTLSAGPT
jgi:hypothetical protein